MEAGMISRLLGIKRSQDAASLDIRRIDDRIQQFKQQLEARKTELLLQRQALNHNHNLDNRIKECERFILEVEEVHEDMMRNLEEFNRDGQLHLKGIVESILQEHATELQLCAKRIEELDRDQFMNALKVKYGSADSERPEQLYSLWKGYLRDPSWQSFQVVTGGKNDEVVIDKNDSRLKELKDELGEQVYEVVVKALNRFNQKHPCIHYPISELWNTSEKRAAFKDIVARLHIWWRIQRGKRPRH